MRRYLSYIYVALIVVIPPVFGQDTQNEEPTAQSTVTEQATNPNPDGSPEPARQMPRAAPSPKGYGYRPTQKRPPAAQYSPLAAAGGYGRTGVTPWQAIVVQLLGDGPADPQLVCDRVDSQRPSPCDPGTGRMRIRCA